MARRGAGVEIVMAPQRQTSAQEAGRTIAIVGAGYSGTLTAIHLLERCGPADRIILFERRETFARGVAYSTENAGHVLNVRAMNMSAFPDRPAHFLEWLRQRDHKPDPTPLADRFVERSVYGVYLQDLLRAAVDRYGGRTLQLVPDEIRAVRDKGGAVELDAADGRTFSVDAAVLACGNFPPAQTRGAYRGNPWAPDAMKRIDPNEPVLILGTGLTMVDVVLAMMARGHRCKLTAVSRRGLLPRRHASKILPDPVDFETLVAQGVQVSRIMRVVRRRVAGGRELGLDWRSVVDGLRPHTEALWRALPGPEAERFLRHLRPWWDAHRHRMSPHAANALEAAEANGRFEAFAGRILNVDAGPRRATVTLRRKGRTATEIMQVAAVFDCTGLKTAQAASADPLFRNLLAGGLGRIDRFDLGLDVDPRTDALIGADGKPSERLFAVGPLTRAAHWEMVAVPDLRGQCARMAAHLAARVNGAGEPKPALGWLKAAGAR